MILILFVTMMSLGAHAGTKVNCPEALTASAVESAFNAIATLDERVRATAFRPLARGASTETFDQRYGELNESFERALSLISENKVDVKRMRTLIASLLAKTIELEAMAIERPPEMDEPSEKFLQLKDLESAEPDRLYEVHGLDPHFKRVSFSKPVVESVLRSSCPLMVRARSQILKALYRGRRHAARTGIRPFENDPTVFKVRIIGESVGALRLSGFFIGEDFHIVDWEQEGSHGTQPCNRIVTRVRATRARFLSSAGASAPIR